MEDEGENNNLTGALLSSVEEAALDNDPTSDADTTRDAWWLRWLKYISIIAVPAILLGLGFLFEDYIGQSQSETSYQRNMARQNIEHDSIDSMKFRFWIGASVGGGLGLIYVVRCMVRRVDP